LLIILLALALAVALTALAFILWFRFSAAGGEPSATPNNQQRALALQPQLNTAIADSRWEDAIAVLQVMRTLDPSNQTWQQIAASAYYQLGVQLRQRGDLSEAMAALDESLKLAPGAPFVQQERQLLVAVVEGLKHYEAKDWQATIDALTPVYRKDAAYADVSRWLSSAYYNLGLDLQAVGDLLAAQAAYESAAELMPDQLAARRKVEEIAWLLRPPTPTVTPTPTKAPTPTVPPKPTATPTPTLTPTPDPADQLILVDISEQRMVVYENDRLIWDWVASTGEPGKDTAIGTFAVRDKIEMAYASTWNLDMPYWLGIYQSGPLENGIHALPIQRANGIKLWEGFLGRRVSYGCVILSDENARTLFEWAQVGAPVTIQW
jgi:lipoprotein-anchoring transpeptidase ErfK/SrfK